MLARSLIVHGNNRLGGNSLLDFAISTSVTHYCMGLEVDVNSACLNKLGQAITGLHAVGELAGGVTLGRVSGPHAANHMPRIITPVFHYSMVGLEIVVNSACLNKSGKAIAGLYAEQALWYMEKASLRSTRASFSSVYGE